MQDSQQQPVFVLIRPQMGENIGAAARAMLNFGLTRLRLTAPRDGWPNPRAVAMASGAGRLLDHAGLFEDTASALADLTHVYATTARLRGFTKPVLDPAEAMADMRRRIAEGERVGVMFGPERAGLETEDVIRANTLVTAPVNPDFPSLNLAQCVMLMSWEWARQGGGTGLVHDGTKGTRPANGAEMEALFLAWEKGLDGAGFFWPDHKAGHMRSNLRNLFSRLSLSDVDVRLLHGMLRALLRARE